LAINAVFPAKVGYCDVYDIPLKRDVQNVQILRRFKKKWSGKKLWHVADEE
jgi:hypothetical protein